MPDPVMLNNIGTPLIAAAGFVLAIWQWNKAVAQRKDELRWKRAEAAWKLTDEIHEDPDCAMALQLVDGECEPLEHPDGTRDDVSLEDAMKALDLKTESTSSKSRSIRKSFDSLLYALQRMESAVKTGYILDEDISSVTVYYAGLLHAEALWPLLETYARRIGYNDATRLIARLAGRPRPEGHVSTRLGT